MSTLRVLGALVLAAIAAVGSLVLPPAAAAAPPSYLHVVENYGFGVNQQYSGGYVTCPSGTKAMSSGAMTSGPLMAGLTTFDGTGAYATAARGWVPDERVQVFAHCTDARKLAGSTLASVTVRDTRAGWHYYTRRVGCPTGTVAYGGGTFVSTPDGPSQGGLYTYESVPDGNGWRYSGGGYLNANQLVVSTHCLPRARLGNIVTVTATDSATSSDLNLLATARCPTGYAAFAGGAWFHGIDSTTPSYVGHLKGSTIAADDRGWTAFGNTYGLARLTAKVSCTTRLG